jgi:threonine/homoserine/homoserine lactone efflux protein
MPIPLDTLSIFVVSSAALALAPGPDNIFVLTQSAMNGRLSGLLVTLGLCTGLFFHTAAVLAGVAAIFATSELAFTMLKVVGAGYLAYLAWRAFRAPPTCSAAYQADTVSFRSLYLRGIIMNVTNPKVAIFFLAFLPQFADPAQGSISLQILVLGAVFVAVTLIVFGSLAWFSGTIGDRLRTSPRAQNMINKVAGTVFLALAIRLLATKM